jgi:pilus assembly protein CpaB
MNSKRIAFLLLAVIVAGATAFLARAWLEAERAAIVAQAVPQRQAPAAKPAVQVLVARGAIRTGQIIKPDDLRWQPWPQGALPATYIIEGKRPISDFVGAVARRSFHVGEPIVEIEIVMPGSRGFLAVVLKSGMRAVSVPATATTAVSGFIYAGDRVDVLLTHAIVPVGTPGATNEQHNATETILRNARVIAVDQKLDFTPGDKPDVAKTATLELTPKQTEIITLAVKMGELSLVLRSLQDPEEADRDPAVGDEGPAELGYSYTHDSQVSRLIKAPTTAAPPAEATRSPAVFLLRGASRTKQELDGSAIADPSAPPAPDIAKDAPKDPAKDPPKDLPKQPPRTNTSSRTLPSMPQ